MTANTTTLVTSATTEPSAYLVSLAAQAERVNGRSRACWDARSYQEDAIAARC